MDKKQKAKEYYIKNRDKIIERAKEYQKSNKDKLKTLRDINKTKKKEYDVIYQQNNKANRQDYIEINKDEISTKKKEYYQNNKEFLLLKQKEWRNANKESLRTYYKERYQNDTFTKLKTNIKNLIGNSLRKHSFKKLSKTEQILGCSYQEFKVYLESKFEPWMNWENRGLYNGQPDYGWDLDHIIPLDTATCEADVIRLNHHTNLQPLCSHVNRHVKRHNP